MPKKTYINELAAWVSGSEGIKRQDKNTVAFLAVQEDVRLARDAGYTLKTIWEHLSVSGRITCSYDTFRRNVRRYLGIEREATQQEGQMDKTNLKPKSSSGFRFDSTPRKEEII
jgi:Family of unknown function (DUF5338)